MLLLLITVQSTLLFLGARSPKSLSDSTLPLSYVIYTIYGNMRVLQCVHMYIGTCVYIMCITNNKTIYDAHNKHGSIKYI